MRQPKLVEKIVSSIEPFKQEADDKTHSWYHIVKTKTEIDRMEAQNILNLLYELESKLSCASQSTTEGNSA